MYHAVVRHEVNSHGARTRVQLGDAVLDSSRPCAVLNRIAGFDSTSFRPAERTYAAMEMHALLLSALRPIPLVVNRPSTRGLCGPRLRPAEWRRLGARALLPVLPIPEPLLDGYRQRSATVVGGVCLGAPTRDLEPGLLRLASGVGCELLACSFLDVEGTWSLGDANATPSLDDEAIAALAEYLEASP